MTEHKTKTRTDLRDEMVAAIADADMSGKEALSELYRELETEKQLMRDKAWAMEYAQVLIWERLHNDHGVRILPTNQEVD